MNYLTSRFEMIEKQITIPANNRYSSISSKEAQFIYKLITKNITKTLEIGFGYGYSAAYIMLATKHTHVTIDPFQSKYENLGILNIKKLRLSSKLRPLPHCLKKQLALKREAANQTKKK